MWTMFLVGVAAAQQAARQQVQDPVSEPFDIKIVVSLVAVLLTAVMMVYTMTRNRSVDFGKQLERAKGELQKDVDEAKKALDEYSRQSHGRLSKQVDICEKRFDRFDERHHGSERRIQDVEKNMSRCEGADIPRRVTEMERSVASQGLSIERIGTEVEGARASLARVVAYIDRISGTNGRGERS